MSKIKSKIDVKDIILIIIVLILLVVNLVIMLKKEENNQENDNSPSKNITINENKTNSQKETYRTDEEIIRYLSTLDERDRIEYYCGRFFKYINHSDYEGAYNLLYSEFKTNYFPTLEDFQKYIEEKFPKNLGLEYDDISRQGNIYVLRLKIIDVDSLLPEENIQRIVIQENNYNDFVMSFQVK